jgi:hypothetical protein
MPFFFGSFHSFVVACFPSSLAARTQSHEFEWTLFAFIRVHLRPIVQALGESGQSLLIRRIVACSQHAGNLLRRIETVRIDQ